MANKSSPVAFVLSGGAGLGAIQVGMLRALYERGVTPDLIVATSAGAINGAFIAGHEQTVDTVDELAAVWRQVRRCQVFPPNPLSAIRTHRRGRLTWRAPASSARQLSRTSRPLQLPMRARWGLLTPPTTGCTIAG
jgi:predicted acylesterase/phospholipase RssA